MAVLRKIMDDGLRAQLGGPRISRLFLVVSGTREEYDAFLRETGIPEKYCRFIRRRNDVFQFTPHPRFEVVYAGNYWDNPVLQDELALEWLLALGAA